MIFANMRLYPGMIDTSTETAGWILLNAKMACWVSFCQATRSSVIWKKKSMDEEKLISFPGALPIFRP